MNPMDNTAGCLVLPVSIRCIRRLPIRYTKKRIQGNLDKSSGVPYNIYCSLGGQVIRWEMASWIRWQVEKPVFLSSFLILSGNPARWMFFIIHRHVLRNFQWDPDAPVSMRLFPRVEAANAEEEIAGAAQARPAFHRASFFLRFRGIRKWIYCRETSGLYFSAI